MDECNSWPTDVNADQLARHQIKGCVEAILATTYREPVTVDEPHGLNARDEVLLVGKFREKLVHHKFPLK